MKRAILRTFAWIGAVTTLYVALLVLEVYWNLFDWQPELNLKASAVITGIVAALAAIRSLARANRGRTSQVASLVACLALLSLGAYVFPAEARTQGLFGRDSSSPLWYRGARLVVLALPSVFWGLALRHRSKLPARLDPHF